MSDLEAVNAKITSTFLGIEDHGIFTFMLYLDYGHSSQAAGTLCLGGTSGCHARTGDILRAILEVVGVDSWEKLPGKSIVALKDEGWSGLVRGLRSFIGDRQVVWSEFFADADA